VENEEPLDKIEGTIKRIRGPQAGSIEIRPIGEGGIGSVEAFFVPGERFVRGRDETVHVDFYVSFGYEGLHAWSVSAKEWANSASMSD
jgi:hypothetical protein